MYHFNVFFIYSILGHLLETVFGMMQGWSFQSGILYGFWTPVYGIGVLIITFIHGLLFKDKKDHKVLRFLGVLLITTVLLSFIEWVGGVLIEHFFHTVFWDYSSHAHAIGKYISLEMALVWGGLSLIFLCFIKPWMDPLILKVPYFVTCILITLFSIDVIATFLFKA